MLLPLVSLAILLVTIFVLGPPVLARGLRSGRMPELTLGLALVCIGDFALPLQISMRVGDWIAPEAAPLVGAAGLGFGTLGTICLLYFTWRVFRPGAASARRTCLILSLALVLCTLVQGMVDGFGATAPIHWLFVGVALRCAALAWTGGECLQHHRRLRVQHALGLATPQAVHRCWLAMIAALSGAALCALLMVALTAGAEGAASPLLGGVVAACALAASIALWLICAPPPAYARWIDARAGAS